MDGMTPLEERDRPLMTLRLILGRGLAEELLRERERGNCLIQSYD